MIEFKTMTRGDDAGDDALALAGMMESLYQEDPFAPDAKREQFPRTIQHLLACPDQGRIVLFVERDAVCGYALLIPFWSNEFGGNVVVIDEIYVRPNFRNRGIAKAFFSLVTAEKPFNAVAMGLEVSPDNSAARRLYASLGFEPRTNLAMTYRLTDP